ENSDLIFEYLDQTNLKSNDNHLRKGSPEDEPIESEYWLAHTVGRLKRSISNYFKPNEDVPKKAKISKVENVQTAKKKRQLDQQEELDDDEDEELDLAEANEDEDDNFSSGESGDGEDAWAYYPGPVQPSERYRITLTINEPYETYADVNSVEYKKFAEDLAEFFNDLYEPLEGEQKANVINVRSDSSDPMKLIVEVELETKDFYEEDKIKDVLETALNNHRIGNYVSGKDYKIIKEMGGSKCQAGDYQCTNGECISSNSRCDGNNDCSDSSDELGCSDSTVEPRLLTEVDITTTPAYNGDDSAEPKSSNCTLVSCEDNSRVICRNQQCDKKSDCDDGSDEKDCGYSCRGDDVMKCENGQEICEVYKCDGTEHCKDGSDEINCPTSTPPTPTTTEIIVCELGEFVCDIRRCLPDYQVCDGVEQCSDKRDELHCCKPPNFQCDNNSKCLSIDTKCNRVADCQDGTDENNCEPQNVVLSIGNPDYTVLEFTITIHR
ncbi:unnamed protein product, partial [Brassicogethes aeneus]